MIISAVVPASQESHLAIELLQHGLELTTTAVDRDGPEVFVDVIGEPYKVLHALLRAGATPVAAVDKLPLTKGERYRPI